MVATLELFLPVIASLLKFVIKNPAAYAKFKGLFTEIYNDLGIVLGSL